MRRHLCRYGRILAAISLFVLAGLSGSVEGHPPDKISQETLLFFQRPELTLRYQTTFGESIAKARLIEFDADRDGRLSPEESDALLAAHAETVTAHLRLRLGEREISPVFRGGNARLLADRHLVARLDLGLDLQSLPDGRHQLTVTDDNFPSTVLGEMRYGVHAGPGSETVEARVEGRTLNWWFLLAAQLPGDPEVQDEVSIEGIRPESLDRHDGLSGLLHAEKLSPLFVLFALALAAGFGAVHALSPGHGKAMVAAYLVGTRGRVRDAVILGGIVTLTHVGSVVVLGLVALFLSEFILPEQLYPWLGLLSGGLIWLVGFWMLARRALGGGDHHPQGHHHDHEHDHDHHHHHHHGDHRHGHSHVPPEGGVTFGSLLALGVSGGMVPCPSALVVLLGAVSLHRIGFGLALIFAFSLGLAAVLILIGILVVKSADLMSRGTRVKESKWAQVLPVFSAGVILLIGTFLAVNALRAAGVI